MRAAQAEEERARKVWEAATAKLQAAQKKQSATNSLRNRAKARAKLEHARNGRMIVTGVCAILSAPMPLLEDNAPTSPRCEPPSRKRARDASCTAPGAAPAKV